ncbi:hypothetical protein [Pseudomonas syringae group genomosp. 7]|uniref:hypothetical protein n=1 Tax=Pseudomonas syringae group genomosp. 7 TaxID=251699 RepID=UPI00376FFC1F
MAGGWGVVFGCWGAGDVGGWCVVEYGLCFGGGCGVGVGLCWCWWWVVLWLWGLLVLVVFVLCLVCWRSLGWGGVEGLWW